MEIPTATNTPPVVLERQTAAEFVEPPFPDEYFLKADPPQVRMQSSLVKMVPKVAIFAVLLGAVLSWLLSTHIPFTTAVTFGFGTLLWVVRGAFGQNGTHDYHSKRQFTGKAIAASSRSSTRAQPGNGVASR